MALINCSQCDHQISDKALACPKCGFSLDTSIEKTEKKLRFNKFQIRFIIASLILLTGASIVGLTATRIRTNYTEGQNHYERGLTNFQLKDYQGAIADFTEAIRLKPDSVGSYTYRGDAKAEQKDYQGAIVDFTEAIRLKPDHAFAYKLRGKAKAEQKNYQGAIADFTETIRLSPDDAFAYYERGDTKLSLGDRQGGIADYKAAIDLYKQEGNPLGSVLISRLEKILRDEKTVKSK